MQASARQRERERERERVNNARGVSFLLIILLTLQILAGVLFSPPLEQAQANSASWYNSSWLYRKPITLSPVTPEDDYQVKVELTLDNFDYSHASTTIRFTGSDGTTLQDYWIEEWDIIATSTVWVEVKTSGAETIYMYYGNSGASSASNGENTFDFFDDFSPVSPAGGWTMVIIDKNEDKPLYPEVVDIDGDGNPDIVTASGDGTTEGVYWHEAPDDPTQEGWTRHTIDNNTLSGIDNAHAITVIDMDNDGVNDIISGGHHSHELAWYSRTNSDGTGNWTKHIIDDTAALDYVHETDAGDVDGDGDIEVFVVSESLGRLYMYEQNVSGDPTGVWNQTTIDNSLSGAFRVYLADIDDDTDLDIVATGYTENYYYWYENPGWTKHQINEVAITDSRAGEPFDVDMDGDLDIVAVDMDEDEAIWYEQDSSNPTGYWTKHIVDDSIDSPFDMAVADINGDGINDIVATEFIGGDSPAGKVVWYSASDPTGEWTKHYIGDLLGPRNIEIYDLDEDGDLDVIIGDTGTYGNAGKLVWFVNAGNFGADDSVWSTVNYININKWNITNIGDAFLVRDGLLMNEGSSLLYLESNSTFSYPSVLHFEFRSTAANPCAYHGGGFRASSSKYVEYADYDIGDIIYYDETNVQPSGGWELQSWKEVDIYAKSATSTQVITDLGVDETLNISVENEKIRLGKGLSSGSCTIDYDYDNVYVRNYTSPEPTFLMLSEENETVNPTISFSCTPTSVYAGQTITCSCTATDAVDSTPSISYTTNPSTSDTGTFTTTCTAEDDAGNSATSSISYSVSSDAATGGGNSSFWTNTIVKDEKEFSEINIITKELGEKERVRIKIDGEEHYIGVSELTETTATIEIFSTTQKIVFNIGDENKFEVTDDDFYDIYVKLNSIENNKANLTMMSIHEEIPFEEESAIEDVVEDIEEEEDGDEFNLVWWIFFGLVIIGGVVWFFREVRLRGRTGGRVGKKK